MTRDQIKAVLLEEIDTIAPGSVPADLDPNADMREAMDLDSMDMLNLLAALHERLGVEIPDVDQGKLSTLNAALDYLTARVAS